MFLGKKIKNSEFASNIIKLVSGTALGHLITVLVSPLLTRLYTADDFGILAIYISVAGILSVVITFRFEDAIVLPSEDSEAIDLLWLGLGISLTFSLVLLLAFILLNRSILHIIGHSELGIYLYLVPLSTFFYGSYQVLSYWMSRNEQFNPLAVSKTIKEASAAITQLGFGSIFYSGSFGLIAGQIIGNATAAGYLFVKSLNKIRCRLMPGIFENLYIVFKKYKRFPIYTSWAALLSSLSQNIPAILLAVFYSPVIAGFYAIASRVLTVPSLLIGNSVRQVYYPKASALKNENKPIFGIYKSTTLHLIYIGLIPLGIILIWGESLFSFVFGASWGEAGIYAAILSPWLFTGFINPPSVINIYILKLNHIQLILLIFSLILRILAIYIGFAVFENVYYSLGMFSLAGVLSNLILIGYIYFKLKKA